MTRVTELEYVDEELVRLAFPRGMLRVTRGIGSGLTRRAGDAEGIVWAVGDRGPNLKLPLAIDEYGLEKLAAHLATPGAKLMPCPSIGPGIAELEVGRHRVKLRRSLLLRDMAGWPTTGLPPAGTDARAAEPALDLNGLILPPDPGGADTESIAAAPDGGFWVGEEYGPSIFRLDAEGRVLARWVPAETEMLFAGAPYPVVGALPRLAARRRLNRGFEGLATSADGKRLFLAFQSPLCHPDEDVGRRARHVRFWTLDSENGSLVAEHLYPLDEPTSFRRDSHADEVDRGDVKICDLETVGENRLVVLERVSKTAKLYLTRLNANNALAPVWSDPSTRPTLEELSAGDQAEFPVLEKQLLLSTDDHPEIGADLEGIALLDDRTILLVTDNDFGVEGVATRFWRVELARSIDLD